MIVEFWKERKKERFMNILENNDRGILERKKERKKDRKKEK